MDKLSIIAQLRDGEDLLSLPQALAEILKQVDNPDFSSDALAKIILKDPSLTGKILKLANSPTYKRATAIGNVHQAVQVLGATTVKCLALSSSVFHPEKVEEASGLNHKEYFSNILTVAAACEKIAEAIDYKKTEDAFVAGLLHDVGTLFLLHHYPLEYKKIVDGKVKGVNRIIDAEKNVFGVDHCEAGFQLATRWRLPDYVCEAILRHHSAADPKEKYKIATIVRLATLLVEDRTTAYAYNLEDRLRAINENAEVLGLSKIEVDAVSVQLMPATISVAKYLGVDIGNIEDMLTKANQEIWRTYLMIENLFKERQELSTRLLEEEHARGASESKSVAMATLSHYLNNAAMAIYGNSQIINMYLKNGNQDVLLKKLPNTLHVIDKSIKKIAAVVAEMSEISPLDKIEFINTSKALNIDDRIEDRINKMESDSGLLLPEEAHALD